MSTVVNQLEVLISGNTRDLEGSLQRADDRVNEFAQNTTSRITQMASRAAGGLLGLGAAVIGTSANLAIEWESAWTNVEKTVSGSEAQLSELETALRNMATDDVLGSMENAHVTLAAIAASAGALGVETSAIDEFTASVAALSIAADDVSAEEIATAAAQFANVTGMDIASEIDNWANAIARLGNEGATTEGQIIAFANRMSTLATVGFEDDQILAYSAAMASLGITAELGGTNFTKSVSEMIAAVATGAPELQGFAEIAGMTADEFAALSEQNPQEAFNAFLEGLSGMDASEQIVQLEQLNITGQEQQRVLMTLAAGYETVEASLVTANEAWTSGNDAMDEAARKADTTQGAIDRLKNVLVDAAIDIGDNFTTGIETMAMGLADLVEGDWVTGLNQLGAGARELVDGFLQLFSLDISMLEGWSLTFEALGLMFPIIFDNIKRSFDRFFLDIQVSMLSGVADLRNQIVAATQGSVVGTIDIAPNINMDLSNLRTAQAGMTFADELNEIFKQYIADGVMNNIALDSTALSQTFGGGVVGIENFLEFASPEQTAQAFGADARNTIREALELALTQGDEGALQVLTPLANELEIDIAKIQADLQAAMAAQSFPVTVTADMTVLPGSMTLPNGMIGPVPPPSGGGAGGVPGATNGGNNIIVNSYGQNPWQMSNLIQQTTADSGVR